MNHQIKKIFLSTLCEEGHTSHPIDDNTEVVVVFDNGDTYAASFFTYRNIESARKLHQSKGDFLNGKYFWVECMVLIDFISQENVLAVVMDLIDQGDFYSVFRKL